MNQNRTPQQWRALGAVFLALGASQMGVGAVINPAFFFSAIVFLVVAFVFFARARQA